MFMRETAIPILLRLPILLFSFTLNTVLAEDPPRLFKTLPYYHTTPSGTATPTLNSTPTELDVSTSVKQPPKKEKSSIPTEPTTQSQNTVKIKTPSIKGSTKTHSPPAKKPLFSDRNWIQDAQKREWILHENKWQAKP